ncbi:uncharacterized protein T551_03279 [Pneumocystis jirovecii RU7]|uniref:Cytochrome c oxidase assembly factor 3 n=1 Tax=Pneumocystis jirovecii (strain RU7) TaxID=1408657 RepID=A0A0W4ZEL5_PNEJ7|nr:uncharacterized protein T551_03279 [Pneumocystis jirovecii RU7]KTW26817.1 hypothetical protein T551_03279 [Pneumocystis jirovecii RU7]
MRFYSTFHDSYVLRHIRKPYTLRNSITGSVLFGFAVGVYFYSIYAVKQDDLSDVVLEEK